MRSRRHFVNSEARPTHRRDQADAANRLAQATLDVFAVITNGQHGRSPGPPDLFRRMNEARNAQILRGGTGTCTHVTTASTGPVVWAAWSPERWVCMSCMSELEDAMDVRERYTCDHCRKYRPGDVDQCMALHPADERYPAVIVAFGLCGSCKRQTLREKAA